MGQGGWRGMRGPLLQIMTARSQRPASQRQLRVGEEMRHVLARLLARGDLRDPALADRTLTVTEVRVSPDLKNATAFVVPLGGGGMADAIAALNRAAGFVRGQLGREMTLRHVPRLSFVADRSFDEAGRVEAILARPQVRRDLDAGERDGEASGAREDGDGA